MIDFHHSWPPPFPHFLASLSLPLFLSPPLPLLSRILFHRFYIRAIKRSIRKKSSLALITVLRKSRLHVTFNTNIQIFFSNALLKFQGTGRERLYRSTRDRTLRKILLFFPLSKLQFSRSRSWYLHIVILAQASSWQQIHTFLLVPYILLSPFLSPDGSV